METLCTLCGTTLKDGARYCNKCGTLVPSHPLSYQSVSSSHADGQSDSSRLDRSEQIAQHSPPRPARYFGSSDPPSWMSQLDNQLHNQGKAPSDRMKADYSESSPASEMPTAPFYEVEQLNTVPLSTAQSVKPVSQPAKAPGQYQQWEQPGSPPAFTFSPERVSAQDLRQTPPQIFVSPRPRRKSRKPLAIVLVLLVLLIMVGGVSAWVVVWQPFSVPGITQPQQSFKDTQLGFSLFYPNGWRFQVDQRKAIAHFYDSSSTAWVNIVVSPSNGEDLGQYLQQEASQLGMTGQKKGPALSFAGALWQQIQGSVLERGASYTGTVEVTIHNQHFFTIRLLAPQITYAREDQLVFSGMRSSFQFVA